VSPDIKRMRINRIVLLISVILLIFSHDRAFSQNQWEFLKGHLNFQYDYESHYYAFNVYDVNNKPSSREHCGSGIFNNKILIFGGDGSYAGSDIWSYDINAKAWAIISNRGQNEVYTDKFNESTVAHPGDRTRMASVMDKNGYFWFFGGETKDLGFHTGWNDLWKFNPTTKNWTWMGGSTTHSSAGSYNVPNTPDWPRARYRVRGWFDKDGNYWIFGGVYFDGVNPPFPLNDMWKYNVSTKVWTCETGDCNQLHMPNAPSGVYPATVGQSSVSYKPRARCDYGYWQDLEGNFLFFGGNNGDAHSIGCSLADTWKYNPKTKVWTYLAQETSPSINSPGPQIEPLCWMGNDGVPWMRLVNRSIWKLNNGKWVNQRYETDYAWESPILVNNQPFVFNNINQPGSHFTTFNHIRNDSLVFLFNGYGRDQSSQPYYTGALWAYSLEQNRLPKLELSILKDDFDPTGESPYTTSNREILVKNTGSDSAKNVVVTIGLSPTNSYSAFRLQNLKLYNSDDELITNYATTSLPFSPTDLENGPSCNFNPNDYKTTVNITIPKIEAANSVRIAIKAEHCMANFNSLANGQYSWNHWATKLKYKDRLDKSYLIDIINNSNAHALDSYTWKQYKAPLPTLSASAGSKIFEIELGSGVYGTPTNNQDIGTSFPHAQARVDLSLPPGVFLANGSLQDIVGEYAIKNGTTVQLVQTHASEINYGFTGSDKNQSYIIKFPEGHFLPIRRIKIKLRANDNTANLSNINTLIRTTYNKTFANMDYGWKTAVK